MVKELIAYRNYYSDFMRSLSKDEQLKIRRSLLLFSNNERIPAHYIKYLKDGIFEFRVTHITKEFRLFFCYDGDKLVVFNGVVKKQQKLRNSDLNKAIKLKKEYYERSK